MVLVDSSAWIKSLRRHGDMRVKLAIEGLLDAYEAQWCSPVRLEVLGGARIEERTLLGKRFSVIPYRTAGRTIGIAPSHLHGASAQRVLRFRGPMCSLPPSPSTTESGSTRSMRIFRKSPGTPRSCSTGRATAEVTVMWMMGEWKGGGATCRLRIGSRVRNSFAGPPRGRVPAFGDTSGVQLHGCAADAMPLASAHEPSRRCRD